MSSSQDAGFFRGLWYRPAPEGEGGRASRVATVAVGLVLIAVITPLSQFLTMMTVNADIETATPVGWAVGVVFSLVLVLAAVRLVSKARLMRRANVVVLYCMLTLAVPVMNLGLVRQCYLSIHAALMEYLAHGTKTYRTAYDAESPKWFPVVPTTEGLAWNKADRLIRLLRDPSVTTRRTDARREVTFAVIAEEKRLEREGAAARPRDAPPAGTVAALARLGPDEVDAVLELGKDEAIRSLGLGPPLAERRERTTRESAGAAAKLPDVLAAVDELEVSMIPGIRGSLNRGTAWRLAGALDGMTPGERGDAERRMRELEPRAGELRRDVSILSRADAMRLRNELKTRLLARYADLGSEELDAIRHDFVLRLDGLERKALMSQDGKEGTPNQNLAGFRASLWDDGDERKEKQRSSTGRNLATLVAGVPWTIWVRPMVMWGLLCVVLFLLVMCAAEWLRRKWIERENLAFPLVEIADNIIRHDAELKTASDLREPGPRRRLFNPLLLAGIGVGFLYLSVEAMGHYGFAESARTVTFDVSGEIFTHGSLREWTGVFLVVSPVVIGIGFLISLEMSFSIWAVFLLYGFLFFPMLKETLGGLQTPFAGWAGGRFYPFPMEQLLGASLCFALILLVKGLRTPSGGATDERTGHFVPPGLARAGMIALPLVALGLLWSLGVIGPSRWWGLGSVLFVGIVTVFLVAQTVAAARARAETGLHTHHVSYEYTKFPMVFGLTGITGARVYTLFITLAFLPMSLLFRTLPQQLENIELARRHRLRYGTIAVSGLLAFLTALAVGMVSFLLFCYYFGDAAFGGYWSAIPDQGTPSGGLAHYPLWVSHYFGAAALDRFTAVHWVRAVFLFVGFAAFGSLAFLRGRYLRFPLHPVAYLLLLLSIYYKMVSPYARGQTGGETSWLWGSVFIAWLVKWLIIKYGGMNTYRKAKPFFIGLVVGSVLCIFCWNVLDLACSLAGHGASDAGAFVKHFLGRPPYSPRFY